MGKLTALKIKSAGPGRHPDGDGLYLIVRDTGSRQWLLRIQAEGKRRDLGLGTAEISPRTKDEAQAAEAIALLDRRSLTLAEAREKADAYRRMVKAGLDPSEERKKKPVAIPTFERALRDCHDELKNGLEEQEAHRVLAREHDQSCGADHRGEAGGRGHQHNGARRALPDLAQET